ncbi:MAG TPA: hypothetical protein VFY90_11455 [Tepidiformaceae bacterium]|nr:hypothetical protein [Tepidiformaceae bacterium]
MVGARPHFRLSLVASLAVLGFASLPLGAACNDQSKEEQLCNDLDDLKTAVKSILDVKPESAREDLQNVRDDVEQALDNVWKSATDVPEVQALEDSVNAFAAAVDRLPESVDIGQAVRDLGTEITSMTAAFQDLAAAVNCE